MQDAGKVLLGSTEKGSKVVDNKLGVLPAGYAAVLKSDDTISKVLADGSIIGVSLGKDLGDAGRTAICRTGLGVPMRLGAAFNPVIGEQVQIHATSGEAVATGTAVNATYASTKLKGIEEGSEVEVDVAFIDMVGGM